MRSLVLSVVVLAACGRTDPNAETVPMGTVCQAVKGTPLDTNFAAWPAGACLDVTFAEGAEEHATGLYDALIEWASAPGTWLCFNAPKAGTGPAPRTVHVELGSPSPSTASLVEVTWDKEKTLLRARVTYDPQFTFTHGAHLHAAGQVLGFQRTDGVDTILNVQTLDDVATAKLTAADLQSVAAVYPACR